MRRLSIGWILCVGFLGCGEEAVEPTPEPTEAVVEEPEPTTPEEVPTPPVAEETPSYAIHEWGLLDVNLSDTTAEWAAGPGIAEPGSTTADNDEGNGNGRVDRPSDVVNQAVDTANDLLGQFGGNRPIGPVQRRKPVLYFHLIDPAPDFTFDLTVHLGGGRVVEHFPHGTVDEHTVRWTGVGLREESCTGGPYPTRESPVCAEVPDGYCEAAELSGYVADDAGCLTVGGLEQNFLFYRGDGPSPELPVAVTRADDGTVTFTNNGLTTSVGPVLRIRRGQNGQIQVAQVAMPAQGQSASIPAPTEVAGDSHREIVSEQLRTIGLTPAESTAFEQAWFGELFDGEAETPHAFPDAVLFFLPEGTIDPFARLEASPPPTEIVRAMAVRAGWPTR